MCWIIELQLPHTSNNWTCIICMESTVLLQYQPSFLALVEAAQYIAGTHAEISLPVAAFFNVQHVTLWEKWDGKDWWAVLCFRGLWCVNEDSGGVRVKGRKLWCSSCWCTELLKLSLFQHQWSWSLANPGLAAEDLPVCGVCSFPDVFVFPLVFQFPPTIIIIMIICYTS